MTARRGVFWPLLLIALGVLFLMGNNLLYLLTAFPLHTAGVLLCTIRTCPAGAPGTPGMENWSVSQSRTSSNDARGFRT